VIELAGAGADGLLNWVEAVENFHCSRIPPADRTRRPRIGAEKRGLKTTAI
jgi:hypothetical protein